MQRNKILVAFILLCSCAKPTHLYRDTARIHDDKRATHEALAKNFMISTQGEASSRAGALMFQLGGNAVDAAAAISFAIAVERPQSTGIGGGGFMLLHFADTKQVAAYDFREKAPLKASAAMFQDKQGEVIKGLSLEGVLAGAVPGMVAGVLEVHQKFGKLTRQQIMAPAIDLAEKGFSIYPSLAEAIKTQKAVLEKFPASKKVFFNAQGEVLKQGDRLRQPDLAKTLRTISQRGRDGFYKGWVADAIVHEQKIRRGLITHLDLQQYDVKQRLPVESDYRGYRIYSMPPPSSGGTHVVQILNMLEGDDLERNHPLSPAAVHLTASAMQQAFADRAAFLGDSDFVEVPLQGLTSKPYAKQLRTQIVANRARTSESIRSGNPKGYESDETTHFTVMDAAGNVVASTQTVNGWLGSGLVVPGTGFLLNNEMDDFSAKTGTANLFGAIGGDNNAIAASKRPLSSMSPTLVMQNQTPVLALGSPSGTRIITCVALTLLNYLDYRLPLFDAVATIRYHHQWKPDEIWVDEPGFEASTRQKLEKMGYKVVNKNLGCKVQAVAREMRDNQPVLHGVADPRGEGLAIGN